MKYFFVLFQNITPSAKQCIYFYFDKLYLNYKILYSIDIKSRSATNLISFPSQRNINKNRPLIQGFQHLSLPIKIKSTVRSNQIRLLKKSKNQKKSRSSTCHLTGFFWLLSHIIYLKLTRVL